MHRSRYINPRTATYTPVHRGYVGTQVQLLQNVHVYADREHFAFFITHSSKNDAFSTHSAPHPFCRLLLYHTTRFSQRYRIHQPRPWEEGKRDHFLHSINNRTSHSAPSDPLFIPKFVLRHYSNGAKSATKRERNAAKAAKAAKGSQKATNAKAMNIVCKVCRAVRLNPYQAYSSCVAIASKPVSISNHDVQITCFALIRCRCRSRLCAL